jgi:polysaccharide biosynthesis protein PslG
MKTITPSLIRNRRWVALAAVCVVMAALLSLDLVLQGRVWRVFYDLTGEERPLSQVRGMVEWLGNTTRVQPNTAPITPISHTSAFPFGVNTFLQLEAESIKREEQLRMIQAAGFGWIRQQFSWDDIEYHARGDFTDRRNDRDGDGQITTADAISTWDKYDEIVTVAERYGLQIQVRLGDPPPWANVGTTDGPAAHRAPPNDPQDFVNYAVAVAERYKGRLFYYQIWNEPNIYPEWGELAVNPERYTEILCGTYRALKAVDPRIVVISGALAPTIAQSGRDLSDLIYLQRMYDAGAGACFDVLSVNGYGLNSGPSDRRMRPTTITFARNLYIRDLMVQNGDAAKSIWIGEAAWNPVDAPDVPRTMAGFANFGVTTPDQAARYITEAHDRIFSEWPWIGNVAYWFFTRPDDSWRGQQPQFYFRMVEPDFSPQKPTFTPTPVYHAMQAYIRNAPRVLHQGVYQAEDWRISATASEAVTDAAAQFGAAVRGDRFTVRVRGTAVWLRWQGTPPRVATCDGQALALAGDQVALGMTTQEACLLLSASAGDRLQLDSIIVLDLSFTNVYLWAANAAALLAVALWIVGGAWVRR